MPLSADISTALHLLEHVQERVEDCDDPKLQMHTSQDIKSLISLLEDPVFRSIVTIQDSLIELNTQLGQHPSIIPGDFDINISGQLELSVPTTPIQPLGSNVYQDLYQDSSELEDQRVPVVPLVHSSSEDTSAQVTSPSLVSEVMGMPPITTTTYAKEFKKVIEAAARGRQTFTVQLYKPEGTSLGFSVVGLRSKDKGELGIFLQEVQPNGIAGCDGRLVEGDQILAIDGQPLDSNISHEQAISILQKARGLVELVVARSAQDVGSSLPTDELSGASSTTAAAGAGVSIIGGVVGGTNQASPDKDQSVSTSSIVTPAPTPKSSQPASIASGTTPTPTPPTSTPVPGGLVVERSPSAVSDASKSGSDMVLNTEWAQVEVINLINDGSGLGFGIVGGRSTGVVVKTILPGGVADRDNRLQSGDHILQIGDVNLRGMGSEQVAAVLRQSGTHVRLVVARPVEPTSPDYQALGSHAPIVPTKILGDPDELDRHLVHSVPETYNMRHVQPDNTYDNGYMYSQESDVEMHARPGLIMDVVRNPMPIGAMPVIPTVPVQMPELPVLTMDTIDVNSLPEMERFTVELKKDIYGLGITIAGYVCEKEELSGIFVKSISEGSAADLSNKIQINDRIVEVDGHSLQGYSNHEAVEVLRRTGQTVVLCLERYLRGPKYDQLQQAIAASELRPPQPSSPSITSLPSFPISADGETTTEIEPEGESHTTVDSAVLQEGERERDTEELDDAANVEALLSDPSSELTPQIRAAIKAKWQKIVGPDTEIVVAQLKKFAEGSGLGISLEGTVDVENGQEVRPHHYIRSILPEGPVGQNGTLRSGDELLEVNGYRLLGINHMEVVSVLKELPIHVRMVCGRNIASQDPLCPIDTAQHQAAFQTRSILGGSLQNLLPTMDRLVKAKSDGSLASTTTTATVTDASLNKMKSRSLEPLTGLAMWSSEPQIIELVKGERGLGFSILDYQDPMNPNETVIVIRSLVPGGVAQVDGQLIPGDRLLFVNDIALENATLDQAVQALKGAPKGTVRIGVAKPLPIPDSIVQRVPPICPVRRSKSFPNESETTDHAAELEDFLSSRSGVTELSMDKPVSDEDEEHWKDASPITPTCSPTKHPPRTSRQRRHPKSVAVEIHDYEPTSPLHEKDVIIIDSSATPPSKKMAMKYNQELSSGLEKVAPKVKLKREPMTECKESEELAEARSRPSTSPEKHADTERGRSLVRTDSEEGLPSSRDVVCKSDASEKGAKKKIYKKRDQDRRSSRRKKGDAEEPSPQVSKIEPDDSKMQKEPEEIVIRSREETKSLREQECIERVTEFLTKHSVLTYSDVPPGSEPEVVVQHTADGREQRVTRPSSLLETQEPSVQVLPTEESSSTPKKESSQRAEELAKTPSSLESEKQMITPVRTPVTGSDRTPGSVDETKTSATTPDTEVPIIKRKSSMRKKPGIFSRESSRESLLDETKKEVRIQENVEEIYFEVRRSSRRKKGDAEESSPQVSKIEPDDSKMQKEPKEIVIRSREERKSLREQECIERVTEFLRDQWILTKHSVLTYSDVLPGSEPEVVVQPTADGREQRVTRPSSLLEPQEPPVQVPPTEESSSTPKKGSSQRAEELAKTPSSLESEKQMITPVRTPVTVSDRTPGSVGETKTSATTPDTVVPIIKRRSSMRKKPGIFSRESSRESLLGETKKEVRIQENVEEIYFEVRRSSRRKKGDAEESSPQVSKIEPDDSKMQKEPEEIVIRSREKSKSLREQECIERVTEFLRDQWILTKHSVLTYSDVLPGFEPEVVVQLIADGREQRVTRPSSLLEPQEPPVQVPPTEESSSTPKKESSQRAEELAKTPSSLESEKQMITPVRTPVTVSDRTPGSVGETKTSATTPDTEVPIIKRRSSMRKKPGIFSRESSRESLLDETKKEVRIQENVEEIYFEDTSEQISGILPEVQLVKARIITAEEAAANRVDEPMRIEVHSPPEVAVVTDSVRVKTGRVPSPETVNLSQLQLLSLAKSTSENTLMDTGDVIGDENRISERNIKAEILLDLSKVPDVGEEEGSIDREKKDRKLSRTGSENSRRSLLKDRVKSREQGGFKIGSLAQPDVPELMILLESAAFGRRKTDDDDDLDSLVDYGVEEEIRRTRDPKADAGSRVTLDQDVESPSKTSQPDHTLDNEAKLLEGDDHPGQPDGETEFKDYDRALWQRRPLLEETVPFRPEEDSLISKEHSLEYQSQTLESQSENLLLSTSLESLLKSTGDSWPSQLDRSGEETERSFKEIQYSPKERHDAETQTEQETKSTQCSPEQSIVSTSEVSRDSPVHFSRGYYQSPRKEVQTQTQGENKSVQCCLDESESLSRSVDFEESFDSPSRSEKSYVKESKSVQCIPEDISVSPGKSVDGEDKSFKSDCLCRSPRREVEVQTCQESKAIQCSDDEILEVTTGQTSEPEGKSSRRTTDSPGTSSCGSPRKLPTLVFVEERTDMTVTQRDHEGNVNWSKHWGPERLVEIYREPKTSLGLSIVGGKVDLHNGSSSKSQNISGIFIKNVLPNSPAGRTGELKIGDRIIEVDGVDVRHSTHERAVEVIQAAGNPVCLRVQSLVHLSNEHEGDGEEGGRSGARQNSSSRLPGTPTVSFRHKTSPVSPVRSSTPEVTQGGVEDGEKESSSKSDFRRQSTRASDGAGSSSRRSSMKKSIRKKAPSPPSNPGILREVSEEKEDNASKPEEPPKRKYSSDESSEEDTRELEGNVYTKAGMEISRKSAGNVKRSKAEIDADPEQEDEFGYTSMKIQKKYHSMGHKVVLVKVEKDRRGLGISLAGHRDRNRMAVFVCGLNPKGPAHKAGELVVGDEILEVNGCVLQGRCHLNASALIKGMAGPCFKIIVLRKSSALNDLAVKPIVQFPPTLEDSDVFNQFKGVRNIPVKKGQYGLGIMIIEGKHAEVGQGIFISDIQEGSAAEQAGLQVGDMILAVNMDCLLGSTYDEATNLLKKAEGVVTLAVCNPNQSKVAKEEEDRAKGIIPEPEPEPAKEPEKPKEPEPPQDPKDCKIVAGRDTTIEFQKEKDKGIGLIIAGGSDTPMKGVFIVEVFPEGAAGKDGRLQSGDQILDMCKQNFKDMEHDKAHASVLQASGTITMVVHRHEKGDEEVEVELQKKSGKGAGLCLTGYKSGKGAYVSDLLPGGSALESGKICKGDRVIAVGGQDVREAPVEDIAVHVKVSNPVQLKLARFKSAKQ